MPDGYLLQGSISVAFMPSLPKSRGCERAINPDRPAAGKAVAVLGQWLPLTMMTAGVTRSKLWFLVLNNFRKQVSCNLQAGSYFPELSRRKQSRSMR